MLRPMSWHGHITEDMVRNFFQDRQLGQLLGSACFFEDENNHFVEFEYKQPLPLDERGVDWLDSTETDVVFCGHGSYWETAPCIMATGCFTNSDGDNTYSEIMATGCFTNSDGNNTYDEREAHKTTGVYVTPDFNTWASCYSWPCNVFGNRAYYGIGSKVESLSNITLVEQKTFFF